MSNPSKQKGTRFEREVADYLAEHGHPHAERMASRGALDRGDLTGVVGWVLECKATKTIDLAGAMDEVAVEQANAGTRYGAAIVKRRRKPVADAYVVLTLETFARLTGDNEGATP